MGLFLFFDAIESPAEMGFELFVPLSTFGYLGFVYSYVSFLS